MKTLTKFNLTRNAHVLLEGKATANYFLAKFKWNANQQEILQEVAKKGYIVGAHKVTAAFGFQGPSFGVGAPTDETKEIATIGKRGNRKSDLTMQIL